MTTTPITTPDPDDHGRRVPAQRPDQQDPDRWGPGRVELRKPAAGPDRRGPGAEVVPMVFDAELVEDTDRPRPGPGRPAAAGVVVRRQVRPPVRVAGTSGAAVLARGGRVAGRGVVVVARVGVRHGWFVVAGAGVVVARWRDAHGHRYERMLRAAEVAGDREQLLEWEARAAAERQRRHDRRRAWVSAPGVAARAAAVLAGGVTAVLVLLGVVLAVGTGDVSYVLAPLRGVIGAVTSVALFLSAYGGTLLTLGAAAGLGYLWAVGRARTAPPAWAAPAPEPAGPGRRDVVPDEGAVVNALRNLNLPALNRKFREGWAPRWELPPVHDGTGWHCRLLLPDAVPVTMIVDRTDVLAHNLMRLPVEVWPTEPRDRPAVLDLWVADPGSLTKPVAPWPLLREGTADYFTGVPVGVTPRGTTVRARLFQANWGVAGMMGSGKSTLIITALLGAVLDPLVEVDVYCMAVNADYDPLRPRLRTLFVSDDPDEIPTVLAALTALLSELSDRGRRLSAAGEPKLTRALAAADPAMRPRVVVIDECQELFVSEVGEQAAELVAKIVAKARKYGVTLIFATPVPSADALPTKVAKVLSNRACFAIGDHQGNDAVLGTGKHKAGITATTLRPMTEADDGTVDLGDLGTAMTVGFTPVDGLLRCYYVRRGDGVDDVTPVVDRALTLRDDPAVTAAGPAPTEAAPDPLADVAAALAGHTRLRTQEVVAALAAHNPTAYTSWTPGRLKAALAAHDVDTKKDGDGLMTVRADLVHEALATRLLTTGPDTDSDDQTPDEDTDD